MTRELRYLARDRTMFLLSIKAGMRAIEIARVTWNMVTDAERASPTPSRSKIGPQKEARRAHHPAASGPEIRSHRAPPRAGRTGARQSVGYL